MVVLQPGCEAGGTVQVTPPCQMSALLGVVMVALSLPGAVPRAEDPVLLRLRLGEALGVAAVAAVGVAGAELYRALADAGPDMAEFRSSKEWLTTPSVCRTA